MMPRPFSVFAGSISDRSMRPMWWLLLTWLAAVLILLGSVAEAQSGGGFGGRSSGGSSSGSSGGYSSSPSRSYSSPSPSRSYGNDYGGRGYSGGGGYSGPIIINSGGGYYGGGMGGISMMGGLMFVVVVGVVMVAMMRSMNVGAGGAAGTSRAGAMSVQVLMAQGDEVKRALQRVAKEGDPDTDEGLAQMLQEAALVVLRHPERWVYGHIQTRKGTRDQVDGAVGSWATMARAAFSEQTTSNYQNNDVHTGFKQRHDYQFQREVGDLYLAVTVMVAAYDLPDIEGQTAAEVRGALGAIASVTPASLIRADVVWSPDAEGEFLTEDEAIMRYPQLSKL